MDERTAAERAASAADEAADAILRADQKTSGLTEHEYNQKHGLIGPSQERKLRRHEIVLGTLSPEARQAMEANMERRTLYEDTALPRGNASIITARPISRGIPRRKRETDDDFE